MPFDWRTDLKMVSQVGSLPILLLTTGKRPDLSTFADLIAFAKANKGHMAEDHDGDPVYMTRLQWDIDRVVRDYPLAKLTATKEMMV